MINNAIRFLTPAFSKLMTMNSDLNRRYKPTDYFYHLFYNKLLFDSFGQINIFNRSYSNKNHLVIAPVNNFLCCLMEFI